MQIIVSNELSSTTVYNLYTSNNNKKQSFNTEHIKLDSAVEM